MSSKPEDLVLSNRQIAFEIRGVFEGLISTEIRRNDEDIDVVVRYDEEARSSLKSLEKIFILNNMGERIKLSQVASYEEVPGAFVIRRYQRKRTISVAGEIDLKKTTVGKMNQEIKPIIEETIASYPKISFEQSGEQKDTKESMGGLIRAAMIAMFGIFIVLLMNFGSLGQPLIIMSTIPLGLIGVVITFSIFGLPLSFMAFMGIVGLVGVVVNDSIVLVTFINERLNKISDPVEAVKDGALSRFRAVVLTTLTTSAGLLPIAHATGGDPFLKPMATSFAYGLMFATTITLVFVPCVYLAYHKMFGHSDGPKGTEELLKEADATN
jgi:multidrug efflux pump subunit AcrB